MLGLWPLGCSQTLNDRMETPFPMPEPGPEAPPPPQMSLAGRLLNIFAAPAEVFDCVKAAGPSTANWLAPALIFIAVSWVTGWLILSQESIKHQLREFTIQAIDKQVEQGRLSERQAEEARAAGEKWADIGMKVTAVVQPVFLGFVGPFLWGLLLWLAGAKALKGSFPYMKAVEVVGLSNMVGVLEVIVKTLLILVMGNVFAAPSLVLLVKEFDPQNTMHALLALANVMTFWLLGVRAVGLARLTGASFGNAALWVYGIWVAYNGFFIGVGLLMRVALKRVTG